MRKLNATNQQATANKTRKAGSGKPTNVKRNTIMLIAVLAALLVIAVVVTIAVGGGGSKKAMSNSATGAISGTKVVIDAGHGGSDAGAIGADGTKEAGLNLKIALRLMAALEEKGVDVIMTRADNDAVAATKDADMQKRREIISTSGQNVTISIHQNHFEDSSVSGPQVFYAPGSVEGQKLATAIQTRMNDELSVAKPRSAAEGNYYITKSGAAPCVIVECGFISNPEEEKLLKKDEYQILLVNAIINGYADFMATTTSSEG